MAVKKIQTQIRLDNVRISFPSLFAPEAFKKGDRPAYQGHFLFAKDDRENYEKIMRGISKVARAKWKGKAKVILKQLRKAGKICIYNGDEKVDTEGNSVDGYPDCYYVSARSYVRPTVVDKNPKKQLSEDDGKIYSGCYVNVYLALWVQTGQWGKRINAQLQGVQFSEEGESFGGGQAADPGVFDSIADEFDDDMDEYDEDLDADDMLGDDDDDEDLDFL
jgi:hypothetical protein